MTDETGWRPISSAPKDGSRIIVLTADEMAVEAFWDASVTNFYKSQDGWASYDPENAQGDWVSWWLAPGDCRLFCGQTPKAWIPRPPRPTPKEKA